MNTGVLVAILSIAISWIVINILYYTKKQYFESHNIKIYYGVVFVWKKKSSIKGRAIISKIAYLSIPLAIYGLYIFYANMFLAILSKAHVVHLIQTPKLLIPGINITGVSLIYFLIAIVVAAIVHELSHALVASSSKVRVKGFGVSVILFLPLAFTEIDEEEYAKARMKSRILTLMAGPASNILLGIIFILLLSQLVNPQALTIVGVEEHSLAKEYGLLPQTIILYINGSRATLDNLRNYLSINKTAPLTLTVLADSTIKNITIIKPYNVSRLGIYLLPYAPKDSIVNWIGVEGSLSLLNMIYWLYLVNTSLGIINIAPLFITDGGKLVYELIKKKEIAHTINVFTLAILVLALLP